ncbi:YhcH/YjgK/YiaL family protein [Algisphaera agarilytica]|uniref:YhcH/YjgK/YiaL family protein n=1 Tax=Algisphaera agarilytica TaxID=1385975 RepID=A0A7X0LMF8_9BACT|nr:YhcH/YjgK/YiaL family protein [Algisphaera agarilytica]MBB6430983.1 YhcH/YjgK/YiaL family protein [Algisphaera agarilytica]
MIYTPAEHADRYAELHPLLGEAFVALRSFDLTTPDGKIEIRGDDLFLNVERYTTQPAEDRRFESHRAYLDVQAIFTGRESIYVEPIERLDVTEPFDAERDVAFYTGPHETRLDLQPGDFAIFFPEDGHKPVCECGGSSEVLKVVAKVRI